MADDDVNDFNRGIIEEFRANDGKTSGPFAGAPLMLMTTTGAKSGKERVIPIVYTRDGDRLVVAASKGGAPTNPDWFHNVVAHPEVTVELPGETFRAKASVVDRAERDRLYAAHADLMPGFADYEKKTDRVIPIVVLERI
ncbi:MAG TPA: nitroreductase family deazaflavin-dependent oxidoreductase [Acidimicrobiia bacterium]|jgi:deazaflavin-dependent oxidoreductase (nitroreductase family)